MINNTDSFHTHTLSLLLILLYACFSFSHRIRASKVRHVHGATEAKKELHYESLSSQTNSTLLEASSTHFGYISSSSASSLSIIPLASPGRNCSQEKIVVNAGSAIAGFQFSPHNNEHVVYGTSDGMLSLVNYYEDKTLFSLNTGNKIQSVLHHPSAANIVAASDSHKVNIYDLEGNEKVSLRGSDPPGPSNTP